MTTRAKTNHISEANPGPEKLLLGGIEFMISPPNLNSLVEFEEYFKCSFEEIVLRLDPTYPGFLKSLRFFLYVMIKQNYVGDKQITQELVGSFLEPRNLKDVAEIISKAFLKGMPSPEAGTQVKA